MRFFIPVSLIAAVVFIVAVYFQSLWKVDVCSPDENCVREWLSATSGWAAAIVAVPTIIFLSRQVYDADRHQRIGFAIQLRKHRVLAERVRTIAGMALFMIEPHFLNSPDDAPPDIRTWDATTLDEIVHHLRDTTIQTFEREIENPRMFGAWAVAITIEAARAGNEPQITSAANLTRSFFTDLAEQAEAYLRDVHEITRTA